MNGSIHSIFEQRRAPTRPGERIEVAFSYPHEEGAFGALLFSPQPFLGGDMDNNVIRALATAIAVGGRPVMRFNYRSVGGSVAAAPGQASYDYWKAVEERGDCASVLLDADEAWTRATRMFQPEILVGYSFGAYVALRLSVERSLDLPLVLIAPPIGRLDFTAVNRRNASTWMIFAGDDELDEVPSSSVLRETFPEAEIEVVAGAGHFLLGKETEVARRVAELRTFPRRPGPADGARADAGSAAGPEPDGSGERSRR